MNLEAFREAGDDLRSLYQGPEGEERLKKAKERIGFVCSPLSEALLEPDTILVFRDGAHMTHQVQALCYDYKTRVISTFEGFCETCAKGGMMSFLTGRPMRSRTAQARARTPVSAIMTGGELG
jgi:uncharacterized protein (DUF169 family)